MGNIFIEFWYTIAECERHENLSFRIIQIPDRLNATDDG